MAQARPSPVLTCRVKFAFKLLSESRPSHDGPGPDVPCADLPRRGLFISRFFFLVLKSSQIRVINRWVRVAMMAQAQPSPVLSPAGGLLLQVQADGFRAVSRSFALRSQVSGRWIRAFTFTKLLLPK